MHQLGHRLASIRLLDGDFGPIQDVPARTESLLVELANQAVEQDGADVVVLAGAPLAGLAPMIRDRVHVPVVDGAEAACKQIEALVSLRVCKASRGSFKSPPAKPSTGLPVPLQNKIGGAYATPESGERPNGA
jgi:Asp/Glu/hydantoin racemase